MFYALLIFISAGLLGLGIYILIDNAIIRRRVAINQREWEAYSQGMDYFEKTERYLPWCEENMIRRGWKYMYYPRVHWEENDVPLYGCYKIRYLQKPYAEGRES